MLMLEFISKLHECALSHMENHDKVGAEAITNAVSYAIQETFKADIKFEIIEPIKEARNHLIKQGYPEGLTYAWATGYSKIVNALKEIQ